MRSGIELSQSLRFFLPTFVVHILSLLVLLWFVRQLVVRFAWKIPNYK